MASAGAWVVGVPERSSQADTSAASRCSRAPCTAAAAHSRARAQRLRRPAFNSAACKLGLGGGHSEQVATDAVYHEAAAQDTGKKVAKRVTCCNTAVQRIVQHAAPTQSQASAPGNRLKSGIQHLLYGNRHRISGNRHRISGNRLKSGIQPGAHAGHRIASHVRACVAARTSSSQQRCAWTALRTPSRLCSSSTAQYSSVCTRE